jgi:hypothetical protein
MMLGLDGVERHQPMTRSSRATAAIWFFTARNNGIVQALPRGDRAIATFADKGTTCSPPSMAACRSTTTAPSSTGNGTASSPPVRGRRAAGSPVRLDTERAEIWLDASSLIAGIRMLFGADPAGLPRRWPRSPALTATTVASTTARSLRVCARDEVAQNSEEQPHLSAQRSEQSKTLERPNRPLSFRCGGATIERSAASTLGAMMRLMGLRRRPVSAGERR